MIRTILAMGLVALLLAVTGCGGGGGGSITGGSSSTGAANGSSTGGERNPVCSAGQSSGEVRRPEFVRNIAGQTSWFTNRSSRYLGNRMTWGQFIRWYDLDIKKWQRLRL